MKKVSSTFLLALSYCLVLTSCGSLMGGLRRDLDDGSQGTPANQPYTTGGRWTERGFLSEDLSEGGPYSDQYNSVGHSERTIASDGYSGPTTKQSWITQAQAESNRRDAYRNGGSEDDSPVAGFSNNPNVVPPVERMYKNGGRARRSDFVDSSENEGSLWASNGQTNYYFTKNKVRGVGDIITINLEQDLVKDISTEIQKSLNAQEMGIELSLATVRLQKKASGLDDQGNPAAGARSPAAAPSPAATPTELPQASFSDIDVSKSLEVKVGDPMMAEIVERYPNGNYKIRSVKRIPYKNGSSRLVSLVAVAKATDIGDDDLVPSGKLYEYRIETNR